MAFRNYLVENAHEMADAASIGDINPDFHGENNDNEFEAENCAEGSASGGALINDLVGTRPAELPDFLSRWQKEVRARSETAPPFHLDQAQTQPPDNHSQTLYSAQQAPSSPDYRDETWGLFNVPDAQQHNFPFAANDLQDVTQPIEGDSHLAMLLATATQNSLAHNKTVAPQPAVMTRPEFMQCLAYFGKHDFSGHFLASGAFFFSSGGFTVWSFFSPTTQQVVQEECTTQIANMSNDEASRDALQKAVTHLARVHINDSAEFLALQQETVHATPSDHMAASLLLQALIQEAIWGPHQPEVFETLQSILYEELIRPDATVDVMAEVICLARILGLTPRLPCAQDSQWRSYLTEMELQLARDGLVMKGAQSGELTATGYGMNVDMQPNADTQSGTEYFYPDTNAPSPAYTTSPYPAQSHFGMESLDGIDASDSGGYSPGQALGSLGNLTAGATQPRTIPTVRKKAAPRRRAKKAMKMVSWNCAQGKKSKKEETERQLRAAMEAAEAVEEARGETIRCGASEGLRLEAEKSKINPVGLLHSLITDPVGENDRLLS